MEILLYGYDEVSQVSADHRAAVEPSCSNVLLYDKISNIERIRKLYSVSE